MTQINLTKKYQEINLDINIVPSNMKTFFNLNNENNEKILQLSPLLFLFYKEYREKKRNKEKEAQ